MKRAPNGYRIVQWSDGFYHVYFGGECLDEVLTRGQALKISNDHKITQTARKLVSEHTEAAALPPASPPSAPEAEKES